MTTEDIYPKMTRTVPLELLRVFYDDSPCHFDHHGGCQQHGFHISWGMKCPQKELGEIIADWDDKHENLRTS